MDASFSVLLQLSASNDSGEVKSVKFNGKMSKEVDLEAKLGPLPSSTIMTLAALLISFGPMCLLSLSFVWET